MFLYYLSSVFICSNDGNEPGEVVGSDERDVHVQDELLPDEHKQVEYKQELHMYGHIPALKLHGKNLILMLRLLLVTFS